MKRWLFPVVAIAALLPFHRSNGAVFERDWKAPGDGLLTYDDLNQREWLDLTQTQLSQFPGVDREAKYQYVASQTSLGGLFGGFQIAKGGDVLALAASAGINTSTDDFGINEPAATSLTDLLGRTTRPTLIYSAGLLDELDPLAPPRRLGAEILAFPDSGPTGQAGLSINSFSDGLFIPLPGVLLYRTAVPEPSSILQLQIAIVIASSTAKSIEKRSWLMIR